MGQPAQVYAAQCRELFHVNQAPIPALAAYITDGAPVPSDEQVRARHWPEAVAAMVRLLPPAAAFAEVERRVLALALRVAPRGEVTKWLRDSLQRDPTPAGLATVQAELAQAGADAAAQLRWLLSTAVSLAPGGRPNVLGAWLLAQPQAVLDQALAIAADGGMMTAYNVHRLLLTCAPERLGQVLRPDSLTMARVLLQADAARVLPEVERIYRELTYEPAPAGTTRQVDLNQPKFEWAKLVAEFAGAPFHGELLRLYGEATGYGVSYPLGWLMTTCRAAWLPHLEPFLAKHYFAAYELLDLLRLHFPDQALPVARRVLAEVARRGDCSHLSYLTGLLLHCPQLPPEEAIQLAQQWIAQRLEQAANAPPVQDALMDNAPMDFIKQHPRPALLRFVWPLQLCQEEDERRLLAKLAAADRKYRRTAAAERKAFDKDRKPLRQWLQQLGTPEALAILQQEPPLA